MAGPVGAVTILDPGVLTEVVTGATAVGSANSLFFCVQPSVGGGPRTLKLMGVGVGGTITTLTVAVNVSLDGGNSFQPAVGGGSVALISSSTPSEAAVQPITAGAVYQVSVSTLALGTATAANVFAIIS